MPQTTNIAVRLCADVIIVPSFTSIVQSFMIWVKNQKEYPIVADSYFSNYVYIFISSAKCSIAREVLFTCLEDKVAFAISSATITTHLSLQPHDIENGQEHL